MYSKESKLTIVNKAYELWVPRAGYQGMVDIFWINKELRRWAIRELKLR